MVQNNIAVSQFAVHNSPDIADTIDTAAAVFRERFHLCSSSLVIIMMAGLTEMEGRHFG